MRREGLPLVVRVDRTDAVTVIDVGVGMLNTGLTEVTDIALLSDLLGRSLEPGLIAVGELGTSSPRTSPVRLGIQVGRRHVLGTMERPVVVVFVPGIPRRRATHRPI